MQLRDDDGLLLRERGETHAARSSAFPVEDGHFRGTRFARMPDTIAYNSEAAEILEIARTSIF